MIINSRDSSCTLRIVNVKALIMGNWMRRLNNKSLDEWKYEGIWCSSNGSTELVTLRAVKSSYGARMRQLV